MKSRIFVLLFLVLALFRTSYADNWIYLHIECSQGQQCVDFAGDNGQKASVVAIPAMAIAKADITSASIQGSSSASRALNIKLSEEAAKRLEKITGENIGSRLMVIFDGKILIAPRINAPIADRNIVIANTYGGNAAFWENSPWLRDLIQRSNKTDGSLVLIYAILILAISTAAFVFILMPRIRRTRRTDLD